MKMIKLRKETSILTVLLLLLLLLTALAAPSLGVVDGRTAVEILKDYQTIAYPKSDPSKKDAASVREFREAYSRAEARKIALALELYRSHPDHEDVPKLLLGRWQQTMMDSATAEATIGEIKEALPRFRDPSMIREAEFLKTIAAIRAHSAHPEIALAAVDEYIKADPKDRRAPILLSGFASEVEDLSIRMQLYRRLVAEYPDSPVSKVAQTKLKVLENLGKPFDLEFTDAISGRLVSVEKLKGKVVVVDFWATWCGPCVAELPRLKAIQAKFKDRGVEFIGISLDLPKEEGGLSKLTAFVAKNEIPWPQYYLGNGWENDLVQKLGIDSIPQLFLIDADGKLISIDARKNLEGLILEQLESKKGVRIR